MFKFFEPNKIFQITSKAPKYVLFLFFIVISVGLTEALILSPEDYKQSDAVRIMYVHVPSAWIALAAYTCIALLSIMRFIFKLKNLNLISKSIAPIGLLFTCLAIITGSLWGQPTWGTWWVWDARITSMFFLLIFYILFVLSNKLIKEEEKANKVSSVIAIVGLVNIPIIKYSVDWWNTLHQPKSIDILKGTSSIHASMLAPLTLMLLVLLLYCALIFLMKYKTEIIRIKKKNIKRI